MAVENLRKNRMMAHLLDSLSAGQDIGHFGRLVFVMVARHFLDQEEVVTYLCCDPGVSEEQARALWLQVEVHDYSPPRRERILAWQQLQEFPICPNPRDPDSCNVYRDLEFPDAVYDHISEYYEEKVEDLTAPRAASGRRGVA